jgi:predicted nucleic-acid-binding protein
MMLDLAELRRRATDPRYVIVTVASKELLELLDTLDAAAKAEREACAKVCDGLADDDYCVDVRHAAMAIRAREDVK